MNIATPDSPFRPNYPHPLFVYFNLHCNYSCSYCFTESGPLQGEGSYLLDRWPVVLDQAWHLGIPEVRISGGEPLLVPRLHQRCRQITERSMTYTITTNGSQLARHLPWLADLPPATLWLSFHDEYNSPHRFAERVAIAAHRLPCVGINAFSRDITRHESLFPLCAEAGAIRFKILHLTAIGRERAGCRGGTMRVIDARALANSLVAAAGRAVELRIEAPALVGEEIGAGTCALRSRPLLSVAQDGRVYPCCVTVGISGCEMGDLKSHSLAEIVARSTGFQTLPCRHVLPAVAAGQTACPLALVTIN